jgi:hypothetical protein
MSTSPENPVLDNAARDRVREARARVAVESWENEGGHFPVLTRVATVSGHVSAVVRDEVTESADLAAMRASFLADFAGSRWVRAAASRAGPAAAMTGLAEANPIITPESKEQEMAKGQQRGNKEARKPKKIVPKTNVSQPSLKSGTVALIKAR